MTRNPADIRASLRDALAALRGINSTVTMEFDFPDLRAAEEKLTATQKSLKDIFDQAGPTFDMKAVKGFSTTDDVVGEITRLNAEADASAKDVARLKAIKTGAENAAAYGEAGAPSGGDGRPVARKSIGELFVKSDARSMRNTAVEFADVEVKTLMQRPAGWAPESVREPGYLPIATAPIMITDAIPTLPTRQAAIKYMEQTTRTNAAAERAEGAVYGEAALALTERSVTVETLGVWIPVTDEQLEDEAEAQALIDLELPLMLRQRLDLQILVGDGVTPNILGVNNKPGIQTQAKGSDPTFDAVHKALTKVRVTGRATPDLIVMHPNDWEEIRLTRTVDGVYILGNPDSAVAPRLWGLPVALSDNQTQNTAIVGDFGNYARLYIRRGIAVERTISNADDFTKGKQAIRAGMRCATVWKRPAAFATVTGI